MKADQIDKARSMLDKLTDYNALLNSIEKEKQIFDNNIEIDIKCTNPRVIKFGLFAGMLKDRQVMVIKLIIKELTTYRDAIISDLKKLGVDYEG